MTIFDRTGDVVESRHSDVALQGLAPWVVLPTTAGYLALFNTSMSALNPRTPGARRPGRSCGSEAMVRGSVRWELFGPAGERLTVFRDDAMVGPKVEPREWEAYLTSLGRNRRNFERTLEPSERHAPVQDLRLTTTGHVLARTTPHRHRGEHANWRIWPQVRRASDTASPGAGADEAAGVPTPGTPIDVGLPNRFTPYEMRGETIWGIELDERDVPTLRAYRVPAELPEVCGAED